MKSSGGALLAKVGGMGAALISHIALARLLGPAAYGDYTLVIAWVSLLALLASAGTDLGALRFVPAFEAVRDLPRLAGFLRYSRRFPLVTASACSGMLLAVVALPGIAQRPELATGFWMGALALPVIVQSQVRGALVQAFKRVVTATFGLEVLRPPLLVGGTWALIGVFGMARAGATAVTASLIAALILLAFFEWVMHRHLPLEARRATPQRDDTHWRSIGATLMVFAALMLLSSQLGIILAGALLGSEQAGMYAVAARFAILTRLGLMATNAIAIPLISEYHSRQDYQTLQWVTSRAAAAFTAIAVVAGAVLIGGGEWLLRLFGDEFVQAATVLTILSVGQVVSVSTGSSTYLLAMTGRQNTVSRVIGMAIPLHLVMALLLIPRFGIEGAALAEAVSLSLWSIALAGLVRLRMGIDPTVLGLIRRTP